MSTYFEQFLSPYLCGYRKGFSTQEALLSFIEKWKKSLDKRGYSGAILMGLSKAFDIIDHELLLAKLHTYGFDRNSLLLVKSYLSNRWQRTKVNNSFSSWIELHQRNLRRLAITMYKINNNISPRITQTFFIYNTQNYNLR